MSILQDLPDLINSATICEQLEVTLATLSIDNIE